MAAKDKETDSITALLVDDEEEFVSTLAERMEMRGLEVRVALDGSQAIEAIAAKTPEVMVLDLRMPGMDGMEVLEYVKKHKPGIEVIVLTGHGSEKDREQAMRLGAFDYLQKPVGLDPLVNRIRKAYRQKIYQDT
ncbi:MAG: response regulator [Desulfobacterales bacterium]